MARLLYEALSRGIATDYVRRLLAAFPVDEAGQLAPSKRQTQESELIEPLSERELKVLQLIAEGLSNREIAARLFLSLNTAKAHARNIYGKLGVHNRTQAVGRARAVGVLPSTCTLGGEEPGWRTPPNTPTRQFIPGIALLGDDISTV